MITYEELMNRVEATERMDPKLRTNYIKSLFTIYLNEPPPEKQVRQEEETEEEQGICLICGGESYHPNSQTCQRDGTCSNQNVDRDERMPEDGEECVNRFREMVRNRNDPSLWEKKDYLFKKQPDGEYVGHEIDISGVIQLVIKGTKRCCPGPGWVFTIDESIPSLLGWTLPYTFKCKFPRKCYDLRGKPISEIQDILDKVVVYKTR